MNHGRVVEGVEDNRTREVSTSSSGGGLGQGEVAGDWDIRKGSSNSDRS